MYCTVTCDTIHCTVTGEIIHCKVTAETTQCSHCWVYTLYSHSRDYTLYRHWPLISCVNVRNQTGLDARKPVFGGLLYQRHRPACTVWSPPFYLFIGKYHFKTCYKRNFTILASLCSSAGWFWYDLMGNLKDSFCHIMAHTILTWGKTTGIAKVTAEIIRTPLKKTENVFMHIIYLTKS